MVSISFRKTEKKNPDFVFTGEKMRFDVCGDLYIDNKKIAEYDQDSVMWTLESPKGHADMYNVIVETHE